MIKKYVINNQLMEFVIIGECKISTTNERCYFARLKGTEQKAWLYDHAIEFCIGRKQNITIPITQMPVSVAIEIT